MRPAGWFLLLGALGSCLGHPALKAQTARSWAEASANAFHLDHGYGDWYGAGLAAAIASGSRDTWYLEGRWQHAFGDAGTYASVGNTHDLSPDWFTHVAVGAGTGDFFFPKIRGDFSLHRKLLGSRRLVANLGVTLVKARDPYRDRTIWGGLTAYLSPTAVAEAGVRVNSSTPGSVGSTRAFAALSLGRTTGTSIVLRGGAGGEGYQLIGPAASLNSFESQEAAADLRSWFGTTWGVHLGAEWYHNPFYTRLGGRVGLLWRW